MNLSIRKAAAGEPLDPTHDVRLTRASWCRSTRDGFTYNGPTYNGDVSSRSWDVPLAPLVGPNPVLDEATCRGGANREAGWGRSGTRLLPPCLSHLTRTGT
ncbi:hypothetical protein [Frankia sp. CiP1_Cm_nod2]|uniref:hypothetical protein n=1 Tax=Frankia sp. CiP1_Cm_nod2 TaxID=2897161 RepID=UPI00202546C3